MAALGDRPGVPDQPEQPDQPEGTGRPERSGGDGRRSGREIRTEAIDEALERAGLPSPRERAREEPGTRDRAENIRFSDAMTDVELTAKGDQVVNREGDDKSRAEAFRGSLWRSADGVADKVEEGTKLARGSFHQPTGHTEVRSPHAIAEVQHHGIEAGSAAEGLLVLGMVLGEGARRGYEKLKRKNEA